MKKSVSNRLRDKCGQAVILGSLLLASSYVFVLSESTFIFLVLCAAALLAVSFFVRSPFAVHIALFTFLTPISAAFWPRNWPFQLLGPLLPYAAIVAAVGPLRRTVYWLRKGKFDRKVVLLIAVTVAGSALGLVLWFEFLRPNLSMHLAKVPPWSPAMLVLAGFAFGFINAAIEESIFRGLLMECLETVFARPFFVIAVQGIAFGLIHFRGIPNGVNGILMATVYGWIQGVIRRRSGGILAPYITHVCLDILIFYMLVFWLGGK